MRLVTFAPKEMRGSGQSKPGILTDSNGILDLTAAGFANMLEVIEASANGTSELESFVENSSPETAYSLGTVRLLAPIPRPRKLICVGLNYRDHAAETKQTVPDVPTIFNKFATAVIAAGETIVLPRVSKSPDYEAEFAFVVGRGGRNLKGSDWRQHIFGYTIVNDVSARDYQRATTQWLMGKTFDTFAPMGPWIVTADVIEDPHHLDISLSINGEIMQQSNTSELIFKIPDLLEYLSSVFTLESGDIISTGTPAGVGVARTPPRFLRDGDDVVIRIAAIGELRNPVAAEN